MKPVTTKTGKRVYTPPATNDPVELLRNGAHLILSISGGKDSDAMTHHLLDQRRAEGWSGSVHLVHADLGRAEWHSTPAYVENLSQRTGVQLHIVRREKGDLIAAVWQRWDKILKDHETKDKPLAAPFPSSAARYCTSDSKRAPISGWIARTFPRDAVVISAAGLRADESPARKKKPVFEFRGKSTDKPYGVSAKTANRWVYDWNPIHSWAESEVWNCIREHGNIYHPAYDIGNKRLSCALCILACNNDLLNGARHNPDTYRALCEIEAVSGFSFKQGFWLSDLRPDLLPAGMVTAIENNKKGIYHDNRTARYTEPSHNGLRFMWG